MSVRECRPACLPASRRGPAFPRSAHIRTVRTQTTGASFVARPLDARRKVDPTRVAIFAVAAAWTGGSWALIGYVIARAVSS